MTIEKLISILKRFDEAESTEILKKHNLKEDLHMNSFSFMMLMVDLEDEMKRDIDPAIFMEVKTVEDLYEKLIKLSGEEK